MARQMQQQGAPAITPSLWTGLSVALEHAALNTDPRVLCAAARTCKAWREAVQQCSICNIAVEVSLGASRSQLRSFKSWLPKHVMLVKSITISPPRDAHGLPKEVPLKAAQLLQQALQRATASPAAAAPTAAAAAAAATGRLPAISSITMVGTAGMLAALPAHSLTQLRMTRLVRPFDPFDGGAPESAALAKLSNLQQLYLEDSNLVCCSCLAGLPQLQQLTLLEIDCIRGGMRHHKTEPALKQLAAQPLPLQVLRLRGASWEGVLDLSRWPQLQHFSCVCDHIDGEFNARLPPQLQELEWGPLHFEDGYEALLSLQQLRSLSFEVKAAWPVDSTRQLLRLTQLQVLQQLSLRIYYADYAAAAAAVWPQLPQLWELELHLSDEPPTRQDWAAICRGLTGCAGLTKLRLSAAEQQQHEQQAQDGGWYHCVAACAKLAGLTNLKHLCLSGSHLVPGDALALTALTGLTRLELSGVRAGVGDLAATGIASSCRQLRHLNLYECDLGSMACLAVVRHLTQLTHLVLPSRGLTQQGLMLLTRLKQLQRLEVWGEKNPEVTDQVLQSFWAAVRQQ